MSELSERAYFTASLLFGRLLRAGRYSRARITNQNGELKVLKSRSVYAPLLVRLGEPLVRILDTGMKVLAQDEWQERERAMYRDQYGSAVKVDADGTLVLPFLAGSTLASLLEGRGVNEAARRKSIGLASAALAQLHRAGVTHGDAMAENVMVDVDARIARWFDFETVHDAERPLLWRRADDVRALLATCLLRTDSSKREETLNLILDTYGDEEVTRAVAATFAKVKRRPLPFHLGQAPMSFESYREIARLLDERVRRDG